MQYQRLNVCEVECVEPPTRRWPATGRKLGRPVAANVGLWEVRPPKESTSCMKSPFYTAEHEVFRDAVRRFVGKEIEPFAHEWDEAGEFPRALYEKAAR